MRAAGALGRCRRQRLPLFPLNLWRRLLGIRECPASRLFPPELRAGEWSATRDSCLSLCFPLCGKCQAVWSGLSCGGGG